MICHGNSIQIVTMNGVLRQSKKMIAQLLFDFPIESIGMSVLYCVMSVICLIAAIWHWPCSVSTRQRAGVPQERHAGPIAAQR